MSRAQMCGMYCGCWQRHGGVNILASGEVQGTITVRLVDVPWEQALEAVLKLTGLAQERQGNVILVAPAERFRSAHEERARARQAEAQTEPKITRVVPVKYANATQLKATLDKLLGACATIAVDGRTNTLILSWHALMLTPVGGGALSTVRSTYAASSAACE